MPQGMPPHVFTSARISLASGLDEALRAGLTPDLVKAAAAAACSAFEERWLEESGRATKASLHNAGRCLDKPSVLLPINDDLLLMAFINKLHSDL